MFDFDFSKALVDFSDFEFSQLGDALLFGGSMLAVGMLTVFAVLLVLWICIVAFKLFIHDLPKKIKKKKKKAAPVVITPERVEVEDTPDEEELIAVITAAIAMAEGDNSGMNFRVVSFKRV